MRKIFNIKKISHRIKCFFFTRAKVVHKDVSLVVIRSEYLKV